RYFPCLSLTERSLASVAFWDIPKWQSVLPPIIETLRHCTTRAIPFSFSLLYDGLVGEDVQLIHLLSRSVPHLHKLELGSFCRPPCLPTFALAEFRFNNSLGGMETTHRDLADADRAAVSKWSERCPSLQEIQLYNYNWLRETNGRFSCAS
ncbi:hypothetical protein DFH06DRAFT_1260003, partial [Mycena polygramma]